MRYERTTMSVNQEYDEARQIALAELACIRSMVEERLLRLYRMGIEVKGATKFTEDCYRYCVSAVEQYGSQADSVSLIWRTVRHYRVAGRHMLARLEAIERSEPVERRLVGLFHSGVSALQACDAAQIPQRALRHKLVSQLYVNLWVVRDRAGIRPEQLLEDYYHDVVDIVWRA